MSNFQNIIMSFYNQMSLTHSGSSIDIITITSDKSTDIGPGAKADQNESTKMLTSTPLKSDPPPLRLSTMETSSGDNFNLPSSIFGSMEIEEDMMNYGQRQSSSRDEEEEVQKQLEDNLRRMQDALTQGKQRKKRQFFDRMLKGE